MKSIHINISSSYIYHGANALNLTKAARRNGWKETSWATRAQADKLGRPLLDSKAKGVVVVLNEKQYTVYNTAQLCLKDNDQLDDQPMSEAYGFGVQMALGEL